MIHLTCALRTTLACVHSLSATLRASPHVDQRSTAQLRTVSVHSSTPPLPTLAESAPPFASFDSCLSCSVRHLTAGCVVLSNLCVAASPSQHVMYTSVDED